ncbi:hypothetical protein ACFPVT_08835 [Corynebacterium choanae]|uniref:Membrane protein YkvI n=1 Tax=Corynebacterium choanae TaxID=1862358 RepID=A0A3G6JA74_9CORY|nr:hypothetical protein [Corynebacterium choanae]AZA13370.1 hypothetical protein CCHOA_04810 [Corynebacterium choanae]
MMRNRVISIAMAFIGLAVGAGFASGQEVMQFFVHFGQAGIWGAVAVAIFMTLAGMIILQLGSYYQANEHTAVLDEVTHPLLAKVLDWSVMLTSFSLGFVMFAGGGANLNQAFGIDKLWGSLILLVVVLIIGRFDVDKVSNAIAITTPLIIVMLIIVFIFCLATANTPTEQLDLAASQIHSTLPNIVVATLNYAGFNLIVVVSMSIVIGGYYLNPRVAGLGGLLGGGLFGAMLVMTAIALYVKIDKVYDSPLPMLQIVQDIHPAMGYVMSIAIYGMIFNSAVGMLYSLTRRLTSNKPAKAFYPTYVVVVLVAFAISFFGFRNLVTYVYPALGYVGVVLSIVLVINWMKDLTEIRKETRRRKKIRDLMMIKLHPRRQFTPAQQRRLDYHLGESNIDDSELHETFEEKVTEAIVEEEENRDPQARNLQ